jgi:hypothetical protein
MQEVVKQMTPGKFAEKKVLTGKCLRKRQFGGCLTRAAVALFVDAEKIVNRFLR